MYQLVNVVPELINKASDYVLTHDRMLFKPFFEAAEEFINEHKLTIGGKIATALITDAPISKDLFQWDIYCNNTYNTAKALADTLYMVKTPHMSSKYVVLKTDIKDMEQSIYIDTRLCFKIYRIGMYRNIDIGDVIRSVTVKGYFGKEIRCLSEEMLLIDVYRTLYNPAKYDQWEDHLRIEAELYKRIKDDIVQYTIGVHGGADDGPLGDSLLHAVKDSAIVIGDLAMKYLGLGSSTRLQIIINTDIESMRKIAEKATRRKIAIVEYKLDTLGDFRITKHSLYAVNGKQQFHLADVFNSTQFELIPYTTHDGIKIGTLWVLLRFYFINLWSLKRMLHVLNEKRAIIHNINETCACIIKLHDFMPSVDLFNTTDYLGTYLSESVAKKKLINRGEKFRPYYPYLGS